MSAELVQQVTRVCKALSKAGARFKSSAMTGGQPSELERSKCFRTQRELLKDGVDVVSAGQPASLPDDFAPSELFNEGLQSSSKTIDCDE